MTAFKAVDTKMIQEELLMGDTKPLYASKTFWGAVLVLMAAAARLAGYEIDAATQAEIVDLILLAIGAGGGLVAIYGRIRATKQIGK